MDMRQFIRKDISESQSGGQVSLQKKQECLSSIDAYIGENTPLNCLQVMTTGWLNKFEEFMLTAPISKKGDKPLSPSTAAFRKKMLVSYCRDAIKQHICPNIEILPSTADVVGKEIERLETPDRKSDMEHLLSLLYLKMERCKAGTLSAADSLTLKMQTRGLGHAILSVLLCGTGYEGLWQVLKSEDSGNRVRLPHLNVDIEVPDHILSVLEWLRSCGIPVSHEVLAKDALAAIGTASLRFKDGFNEPFTQWIELAISLKALTHADARKIIDARFADADSKALQPMAQRVFDAVISGMRNFSYSWYCIKSIFTGADRKGETSGGERLLTQIEEAANIHPVDTFCPKFRIIRDRDGRKEVRKDPLWDAILLAKVNQLQIESVNRYLMSKRCGFIYGIPGVYGMTYSKIRDREVDIIRDFFEEKARRRISPEGDLTGITVQVTTGLYEGYDGTIVKVVYDKERNIHRLILKLEGASLTSTYAADPDYLSLPQT